MKKILALTLVLVMVLAMSITLVACNGEGDTIVIWTFTDELEEMIDDYYLKAFPDVVIEVVSTPIASMCTKLDNAIKTGKNLPDLVALEEKVLSKYIASGQLESLEDIATEENTGDMYDYTLSAAENDKGEVVGMAWQATPGAYFYRRSMAEALWGYDEPEKVQEHLNTWENFIKTAEELKALDTEEFSDVRILSSLTEPSKVFYAQRNCGWVNENSELTISSNLYQDETNLYDVMKSLQGNGSSTLYVNEQVEWNTGWYADMSSNGVFGFFQSSWGLHYNLKKNCVNSSTGETTSGDWGVVQGPGAFSDGGTWLSVIASSEKKAECKEIIKYFTTNTEFLSAWAKATGDFMNNEAVMNEVKADYSEEFLGGQNHYEILFESAKTLNGNYLTKYDQTLNSVFQEWAVNYAMGEDAAGDEYDKAGAIEQFKLSVAQQYTGITVPD